MVERVRRGPKALHPLRRARLRHGLSQEALAGKAGVGERTIRRLEAGTDPHTHPETIRRLSASLEEPPEALGLLPYGRVEGDGTEDHGLFPGGGDDVRRRELLGALGLASGALASSGASVDTRIDWLRLERARAAPGRLDDAVLRDHAALINQAWWTYRAAPDKGVVLQGVTELMARLTRLAEHPHASTQHKRLCGLISDLAQLAGEVQFDADHLAEAAHCYGIAADAAKEAGHYDLLACALVRHAFVALYDQRPHQAVPLLEAAGRVAVHGDGALATRHWVAAVAAEAYAGVGDRSACQRALDFAEGVYAGAGSNGSWLRFDGARLPEERGACYVRLGQPDLAEPALQVALARLPAPTRRRGLVLSDLARSALLSGDVERACAAGREATDIARVGHSGVLAKGLRGLHAQLTPYRNVRAVADLNRQIEILA
jgi:transcriptional regulator with XRE-family HTH domain